MRSFGGEVIKRSHWITGGRGGGQDGPKKDHIIFERSLMEFDLTGKSETCLQNMDIFHPIT